MTFPKFIREQDSRKKVSQGNNLFLIAIEFFFLLCLNTVSNINIILQTIAMVILSAEVSYETFFKE